jgi:hypothetical protein
MPPYKKPYITVYSGSTHFISHGARLFTLTGLEQGKIGVTAGNLTSNHTLCTHPTVHELIKYNTIPAGIACAIK